jgi:hypothetical protein
MKYVKSHPGWNPDLPNPFSPDGTYGLSWSALTIDPDSDERLGYPGNCRGATGCFRCTTGMRNESFSTSLGDFLRYETNNGRTVIISCPEGIDIDKLVQRSACDTPPPTVVRESDPRWVVHSTALERWDMIRGCGELRSSARLRREGVNWEEVGFHQLGEPEEYREYVVLGDVGNVSSEHVIASHQHGFVFTDESVPYQPGVRLYFDAHRIISGGLAVRDGLHPIKVHERLPLDPYLLVAIGVRYVDPEGRVPAWTPKRFIEAANARFRESVGVGRGGTESP